MLINELCQISSYLPQIMEFLSSYSHISSIQYHFNHYVAKQSFGWAEFKMAAPSMYHEECPLFLIYEKKLEAFQIIIFQGRGFCINFIRCVLG